MMFFPDNKKCNYEIESDDIYEIESDDIYKIEVENDFRNN